MLSRHFSKVHKEMSENQFDYVKDGKLPRDGVSTF